MNSVITEITDNNGFPRGVVRWQHAWVAGCALPILALSLFDRLPGWEWMWVMALALFLASKCITISSYLGSSRRSQLAALFGYCLLWPGMDPAAFGRKRSRIRVPLSEWTSALFKTATGGLIVWEVVPLIGLHNKLLAGWAGMVGIVFFLHFGLFHLLSIAWRELGFDARPIMRSPGTATSLSKFWGENWNNAFSDLVHEHLFKPVAKMVGPHRAMFAVFLVSGFLHELVISLPARGGYGLPTAYFLLQSAALVFERSKSGRTLGLGSGWRGWCFVLAIAGGPAFLLFPPVFVRNVILPMLRAIGVC